MVVPLALCLVYCFPCLSHFPLSHLFGRLLDWSAILIAVLMSVNTSTNKMHEHLTIFQVLQKGFFIFLVFIICFMEGADIWATSWENLSMPYANNKGADQPAHPRSLISAFVVRCLDSIIPLVSISIVSSLYLTSVAAQAGSWRGSYIFASLMQPCPLYKGRSLYAINTQINSPTWHKQKSNIFICHILSAYLY